MALSPRTCSSFVQLLMNMHSWQWEHNVSSKAINSAKITMITQDECKNTGMVKFSVLGTNKIYICIETQLKIYPHFVSRFSLCSSWWEMFVTIWVRYTKSIVSFKDPVWKPRNLHCKFTTIFIQGKVVQFI